MAKIENIGRVSASIKPDDTSYGRCRHNNPLRNIVLDIDGTTTRERKRMESLVKVCIAGSVAQKRYNSQGFRYYNTEDDRIQAIDLLSYFTGTNEELEAYYRLLEIQTRQTLSLPLHWEVVKYIAQVLLQKESISSKDITHAFNAAKDSFLKKELKERVK